MLKDYTKLGIAAVLTIFLVFLLVQIVKFTGRRSEARAEYGAIKTEHDAARADRERLEAELSYFSNPENLSKELRSRFNYALPGEKMLILVEE